MFNIFKKKKNYIDSIDVNKISKTKLQEISDSAFGEGSHLKNKDCNHILADGRTVEQAVKDSYIKAIKAQQDSPNSKFHRTPLEEDLSFEFSQKNKEALKKMEDIIYDLDEEVVKIRKSKKYASKYSLDEIINICEKEISVYNNLKEFCYSKGKAGKLYFQDMWEFCYYNWDDCFPFIRNTLNYLEKIKNTNIDN